MENTQGSYMSVIRFVASLDRLGVNALRIGSIIVLGWIGVLKVAPYERRGIVPFMANSPFFSWMLKDPENYAANKMAEGSVDPAKEAWHAANGTDPAAYFVGITIVSSRSSWERTGSLPLKLWWRDPSDPATTVCNVQGRARKSKQTR